MDTNNPNYKHGMSNTKIYSAWKSMNRRVTNKKSPHYKNYGGRGITVCARWKNNFSNFFEDMGDSYKNGLTLDRIDNNKGYSKSNCRWATKEEQSRNRRNVKKYDYLGDSLFLSQYSKKYNINLPALKARITKGLTIKEAIEMGDTSPKYYSKSKKDGKFRVEVTKNGNRIHGGTFEKEEDAIKKVSMILKNI